MSCRPTLFLIVVKLLCILPFNVPPRLHVTAVEIVVGSGVGGGITIGGGGGSNPQSPPYVQNCPPPPPPPEPLCPPPPPPPPTPPPPPPPPSLPPLPPPVTLPFENPNIKQAFHVIQRFKSRVTFDPTGITKTWVGPDVCSYEGFRCARPPKSKDRALSDVQFNGRRLKAPLAGFIDKLPNVSIFHANSNKFIGSVPKTISKLPFLFELDLSNNGITGAFPDSVFRATQLTFLDLRFNSFSGMVPPELFSLQVDVLFINNNKLEQRLPDDFKITALYLTFSDNKFTGPIPKSLGLSRASQINLLEVVFFNNRFSGCLPCEIGLLEEIRVFDVSVNQLTGPIPLSFACLSNLVMLNLAHNQFYGPVPEEVCKLPDLSQLNLTDNYFTQLGPECRKLLQRTPKVLDVGMNCIIDLPNQKSKAECAEFFSQRKSCPDHKIYNWMPCKGKFAYLVSAGKRGRKVLEGEPTSFVTYGVVHNPQQLGGDQMN